MRQLGVYDDEEEEDDGSDWEDSMAVDEEEHLNDGDGGYEADGYTGNHHRDEL